MKPNEVFYATHWCNLIDQIPDEVLSDLQRYQKYMGSMIGTNPLGADGNPEEGIKY